MKKLISLILVSSMLFPNLVFATRDRKDCVDCNIKATAHVLQEEKIARVCNDFSDVLCKDVKLEERRSCSESDSYIISKETKPEDLLSFAQGCFKSGVTSMWQFVTEFIPELLKAIWQASKETYGLAVKSVVGNEPGLWSKLKGMYESTVSVSADIFEAVNENPAAYFDKIWSRIVDVVGPMVANVDCLKPQLKVEKICGLVAEWIVPPWILGRILFHGIKEIKFLKATGVLSMSASGKLAKALEFSAKKSMLTLKELQAMEIQFKGLGYTAEEFTLMYKTGSLEKFRIADLKSLSTAEGRLQKKILLGETKKVAVVTKKAAPLAAVTALQLPTDFVTTTKIGLKGEKLVGHGQIIERVVQDGKEVAYRVRMVEMQTGKVFETTYSAVDLAKMNAKASTHEIAEKVTDIISKDKKYATLSSEFAALQKESDVAHAAAVAPNDLKMIDVTEAGMDEFRAVEHAQVKAAADAKAAREAAHKPAKMEGVDANEVGMDEFNKAIEANKEQAIAKAKALEAAERKRIADQGVVKHDGMTVEELNLDDPRIKHFTETNPHKAPKGGYDNGIDYVESKPGVIVKSKESPKSLEAQKSLVTTFKSNYIQVMRRDSMGSTTYMPAQIIKRVLQDNREKFVIRVLDKTSNTYKEMTVSLAELKSGMRAREVPAIEREIKDFNRQTGYQDDLVAP